MDPVSPTKNIPTLQELEEVSSQNISITPSQNVSPPTLIPQPPSSNIYYYVFGSLGILTIFMFIGTLFIKSPPKKNVVNQSSSTTVSSISPTSVPRVTAYANPFDEESSYQNPFSQSTDYQNPFEDIQ